MKNLLRLSFTFLFALAVTASFAQAKKTVAPAKPKAKPTTTQAAPAGEKKGWPEMQAFHEIMSQTFHPIENGDYAPVKANSKKLVELSRKWQSSTVPANFIKDQTADVLERLTQKCMEVDQAVQSGADEGRLRILMGEAHETFHELVEKCRKPEEEKKGGEKEHQEDHK